MEDFLWLFNKLKKYVVGAEGNISLKTEDGFLIKASGLSFQETTKSNLAYCNLDGTSKQNQSFKPSMEANFHSYFFTNFDVNYIAHTHPTNLVKISCTNLINKFATTRLFPDQVIFNGTVSCIVPYATPGIELKNAIEFHVKLFLDKNQFFPKTILLQNHGLICASKTAKECLANTEICEKAAEIFLHCNQINTKINFLSKKQINKLVCNEHEIYRQKLIQNIL